jgi:hypothetical protein
MRRIVVEKPEHVKADLLPESFILDEAELFYIPATGSPVPLTRDSSCPTAEEDRETVAALSPRRRHELRALLSQALDLLEATEPAVSIGAYDARAHANSIP